MRWPIKIGLTVVIQVKLKQQLSKDLFVESLGWIIDNAGEVISDSELNESQSGITNDVHWNGKKEYSVYRTDVRVEVTKKYTK